MKIRHGFVSNSSSSSFLIYGVKLSIDSMNQEEDIVGYFDSIFDEDNIFVCLRDDDYNLFIGRSWRDVKDTQTGLEFKNEVESIIRDKFSKIKWDDPEITKIIEIDKKCLNDLNFTTHSKAWYNG